MKIACQARTFILIFAKNSNSNSSNFAREDGEVGEWYWPSGIDWARVAVASCHLPFGSFVFCNFAIEMQHWFELQTRELLRCNSPDFLLLFYSSYWHVTIAPNQPITPPPPFAPPSLFANALHNSWHNSRWRGHKMPKRSNPGTGYRCASECDEPVQHRVYAHGSSICPARYISMCFCEYPNHSVPLLWRGGPNCLKSKTKIYFFSLSVYI